MNRRIWPLIVLAFAALLCVISVSAYVVIRQTRLLLVGLREVDAEAREREQVLRDIRDNSANLAIGIRDLLLDTAEIRQNARQRLEAVHEAILSGLARLENSQDPRQQELVRELSRLHKEYWRSAVVPLGWPEQERRGRGILFLRQELAPLRKSASESARNVEWMEETLLRERRARTETFFSGLDAALIRALALALSIGVLIAVLTVWRFSRLEVQAESLQLQTSRDREQLRVLSQSLVHAQEEERKSLSRELHDQIGQMLTAIQMAFTNIELGCGDAQRHIEDGKALTARTVGAVRNISMGLRPSILDDFGLGPAIEWQAREFSKHSGTPVKLQLDGYLGDLNEGQNVCLYRVIQEALTNCARHARATSVRVNLHVGKETTSLTVEDDGQGFDLADLPRHGLGLFGMRERVGELGGTVSILAQPGKGTLVRIEIPSGGETHV